MDRPYSQHPGTTLEHELRSAIDDLALANTQEHEEVAADPLIGEVIGGRYTITRHIGVGGMGVVYKARQESVDRDVAIKILPRDLDGDEGRIERFQREARAASRLRHPNTITLFEFGSHGDMLYIAMEYLDGVPLSHVIEGGPMDPLRAIPILTQTLRSLSEAHAEGIIHRDIKPDNIILIALDGTSDFVKVLDFGVAKINRKSSRREDKTLTQAGMIFGTPQYMSPEQGRSQPLDATTDLYAVAVMGYELLTGCVPFDEDDPVSTLLMHCTEPVPAMSNLNPAVIVPPALEACLLRALAKEPGARYRSAEAMIQRLEEVAAELQGDFVAYPSHPRVELPSGGPYPTARDTPPPPPSQTGQTGLTDITSINPSTEVVALKRPKPAEPTLPPQLISGPTPALVREPSAPALTGPIDLEAISPARAAASPVPPPPEQPRNGRRVVIGALGLLLVLATAAAAAVLTGHLDPTQLGLPSPGSVAAVPDAPRPTHPAPNPATPQAPAAADAAAAEPGAQAGPDDAASPAAPDPIVTLSVESTPSGAVLRDAKGAFLGKTPYNLKRPRDPKTPLVITAVKKGYQKQTVKVALVKDQTLNIALVPRGRGGRR